MQDGSWHVDFNPQKFFGKIDIDAFNETNQIFKKLSQANSALCSM